VLWISLKTREFFDFDTDQLHIFQETFIFKFFTKSYLHSLPFADDRPTELYSSTTQRSSCYWRCEASTGGSWGSDGNVQSMTQIFETRRILEWSKFGANHLRELLITLAFGNYRWSPVKSPISSCRMPPFMHQSVASKATFQSKSPKCAKRVHLTTIFQLGKLMLGRCGKDGHAIAQAVRRRWLPGFEPMSSHMGFVVDEVTLRQVFSEYLGFPCQLTVYQMLHTHLSYGTCKIGQLLATYQVNSASLHSTKL
jgi:hypothetical protein